MSLSFRLNVKVEWADDTKAEPSVFVEVERMEEEKVFDSFVSLTRLARAIERCQGFFWGNSSYAVLYCICRDYYHLRPNRSAFERMVESLPYDQLMSRSFTCPHGTIANAFRDNPIFREHVDSWEGFHPLSRIIVLRDELLKEIKVI